MQREYENEQHRLQALTQQERNLYHTEYQIRQPSRNRPNYDLPTIPQHANIEEEQSRFLRSTSDHESQYADTAQYERKQPRATGQSCMIPDFGYGDMFELPATAFNSPTSSTITPLSSTSTSADATTISATLSALALSISNAEARLAYNRTTLSLEEKYIQHLKAQFCTLDQIRQHVQERQRKDKGAYQNTYESAEQTAQPDKVPHFMNEWLPAPAPAQDQPDEDETPNKLVRCKLGRPIGKVLHPPPADKYYPQGLCEKHMSESTFRINMGAYSGDEPRTHAWKCL